MSHHFLVGVVLMSVCAILMINVDGNGSVPDPSRSEDRAMDQWLDKIPQIILDLEDMNPANPNATTVNEYDFHIGVEQMILTLYKLVLDQPSKRADSRVYSNYYKFLEVKNGTRSRLTDEE